MNSITKVRFAPAPWILFLLIFSTGCEDDDAIVKGIPENIRYLSLSHNSSSATIVINNVNVLTLKITAYDANKKEIFLPSSQTNGFIKIEASDGHVLDYPYEFKPSREGTYSFRIKGLSDEATLNGLIEVKAILEKKHAQVTLPVIFHYITNEEVTANKKEELTIELEQNLSRINMSFGNLRGSKDPNGSNAYIQFSLAEKKPEGDLLEVKGLDVVKINTPTIGSINEEIFLDVVYDGNFWFPKKYINVWVARTDDGYSWAFYPELSPSSSTFPNYPYGVFLNAVAFHNKESDFLAHEIGHILNLWHVFDDCNKDGDLCADTWDFKNDNGIAMANSKFLWSCSGQSFIRNNYMDYGDFGKDTFSAQQVERMRYTLDNCPFLPTAKNISGRTNAYPYSTPDMKPKDVVSLRIN